MSPRLFVRQHDRVALGAVPEVRSGHRDLRLQAMLQAERAFPVYQRGMIVRVPDGEVRKVGVFLRGAGREKQYGEN